jgi:hypothetical protein
MVDPFFGLFFGGLTPLQEPSQIADLHPELTGDGDLAPAGVEQRSPTSTAGAETPLEMGRFFRHDGA